MTAGDIASYSVFISHGWHDRWIATQMARLIEAASASAFVDVFDIRSGDRIEERIRDGIERSDELVALLTPWSVDRNWVWTELSAAWALRKRFVGVLFGISIEEIEKEHGGMAMLRATNVIVLNDFATYLAEMTIRANGERRT